MKLSRIYALLASVCCSPLLAFVNPHFDNNRVRKSAAAAGACLFASQIGIAGIPDGLKVSSIRYLPDEEYIKGEHHIFYVVRILPDNYWFYDVRVEYDSDKVINVVNNFAILDGNRGHFEHKNPPLGGVYSQDYLQKKISQVLLRGDILSLSEIISKNSSNCESVF